MKWGRQLCCDAFWKKSDEGDKNSLRTYHMQTTVLVPHVRFYLNFIITWYLYFITYINQTENWGLALYELIHIHLHMELPWVSKKFRWEIKLNPVWSASDCRSDSKHSNLLNKPCKIGISPNISFIITIPSWNGFN